LSFRWAEEGGHDTGWAEEVGPPKAEEVGLRMAEGGRATGQLLRAGPAPSAAEACCPSGWDDKVASAPSGHCWWRLPACSRGVARR